MPDSVSVSTTIQAPADKVWAALTDPKLIKSYFFGAEVKTDWKPGSDITWSGQHDGKTYVDKGKVKAFEPNKRLSMTHWSPMSGKPDAPENYHTVTYELAAAGAATKVTLRQDHLLGMSEAQAEENWRAVLEGLKTTLAH